MITVTTKDLLKKMLPDRLVYAISMRRSYDPIINLLRPFVRDRVFVDIGSNTGVYSYFLQSDARQVIAFEPLEEVSARLAARNPGIDVMTLALSEQPGTMEFFVPHVDRRAVYARASLNRDANPGFALTSREISVRRLDDLGIADVGAIKIDVEGHEFGVLKGAVETLRRERPVLVVEIEERHHPGASDRIVSWIVDQGYTAHCHEAGELVPLGGRSVQDLQPPDNGKDPFSRSERFYVNNFLFRPA